LDEGNEEKYRQRRTRLRRLLFIGLLIASGCGDPAEGPPYEGCDDPNARADCNVGGFGGDGGAGGAASTTEMFTFYVPDFDCWFWDAACDPPGIPGVRFNTDYVDGPTYLEGTWWAFRGERIPPDAPPILPDRVEVCVRKEYENRQVIQVVDQCFDAEWEVLAGQVLSIAVGSSVYYVGEAWWYKEIRLYFDPV